jgi:hypothetical protein
VGQRADNIYHKLSTWPHYTASARSFSTLVISDKNVNSSGHTRYNERLLYVKPSVFLSDIKGKVRPRTGHKGPDRGVDLQLCSFFNLGGRWGGD